MELPQWWDLLRQVRVQLWYVWRRGVVVVAQSLRTESQPNPIPPPSQQQEVLLESAVRA